MISRRERNAGTVHDCSKKLKSKTYEKRAARGQVVGCIVEHEGRLLLCRRAIEPCKGHWTVPAGFLEMGESSAAGAARETWEEANARVEVRVIRPRIIIETNGMAAC